VPLFSRKIRYVHLSPEIPLRQNICFCEAYTIARVQILASTSAFTTLTKATSNTKHHSSIMSTTYWPTVLVFLGGNLGFLSLYYCYRRGQRQLEADAAAHDMEVLRQQQILQDRSREAFGSHQHNRRRGMSQAELAQLLVSGVSNLYVSRCAATEGTKEEIPMFCEKPSHPPHTFSMHRLCYKRRRKK
jgi:hypothetical protein